MKPRSDRTATDIYKLGFKEPYLRSKGGPFIKWLNWYTGVGKTYNASVFALELLLDANVIPVFIAPLQSLVKGFAEDVKKHARASDYADGIEALVRQRNAPVTVHRLFSRDYHVDDRTFFDAVLKLYSWLKTHPEVLHRLERANLAADAKTMSQAADEMRKKANICLQSKVFELSRGDDLYEDTRATYDKAAKAAHSAADRIVKRLIELDVQARSESKPGPTLLAEKPIADMVRRLQPLQAFLDDPGVIVSTASKAQVKQQVYLFDPKASRLKWHTFDTLPIFLLELNRDGSPLARRLGREVGGVRVVTFVDEEEDSYWYLFDQRKSVLNQAGRNDLNIVITEFFTFLDLKWPRAFERAAPHLACKVFEHLEKIAEVSQAAARLFEEERVAAKARHLPDSRRIVLLRMLLDRDHPGVSVAFSDGELLQVLHRLIDQNDAHNNFERFNEKARILAKLRDDYLRPLAKAHGVQPYETYRRVCDLVVDKKYFTMSRASFGEVLDQPGQTFFSGESNIMATEFLKQVELLPETAGQTIRLVYHEGTTQRDAFTLFNYLELVLLLAKALAVESGDDAVQFSKDDIERYALLHRFRGEVRSLFQAKLAEEGLHVESEEQELLTEEFFFNGTKSVVTLEESRRQADEYNLPADVNLTITITSLRDTPEDDIARALGESNGVYLMSATGGLPGVSSGAFNVAHLKRLLQAKGGHIAEMSSGELAVVGALATARAAKRHRDVVILDDDEPAPGFNVSSGYHGLLQLVMAPLLQREEPGFSYLNSYKRQEIAGLVASLDVLLSSDVRSGLVLCQTMRRAQKAMRSLASGKTPGIEQLDSDGYLFRIRPEALPAYRGGQKDPVLLVMYAAERFRRRDPTRLGMVSESDDDGQFNDELKSALDISEHKVLLWTAYGSASRGMNFVTRYNGRNRDFELFCLLNDPYYNRHTRPGTRGFSMEMFQSFLQVLRDEGPAWGAMTREDVLFEYARNRWQRLRKEHYVDITRTVFQALGRGEREPDAEMPTQRLLVSGDAARTVHLGIRYAPELVDRASPAQRAVLAALAGHNKAHALFQSDTERKEHERGSLKRAIAFRDYTAGQPRTFRSDDTARRRWQLLFDTRMFTKPQEYMQMLRKKGIPAAFVDGAFFLAPPEAVLFTKEVAIAGVSELVLTDAIDGSEVYDWVGVIASAGLTEALSARTKELIKAGRRQVVETPSGPRVLVPQPWFVAEIMKGYVAEEEFVAFIEEQFRVSPGLVVESGQAIRYIDPLTHPDGAALYQLFDFYLEPSSDKGAVVAVDMKNWARATDRLKKTELQRDAKAKLERLAELFPGREVKAVYVNLCGALKYLVDDRIHFMSMYVQTNRNGQEGWMTNENLAKVLVG